MAECRIRKVQFDMNDETHLQSYCVVWCKSFLLCPFCLFHIIFISRTILTKFWQQLYSWESSRKRNQINQNSPVFQRIRFISVCEFLRLGNKGNRKHESQCSVQIIRFVPFPSFRTHLCHFKHASYYLIQYSKDWKMISYLNCKACTGRWE